MRSVKGSLGVYLYILFKGFCRRCAYAWFCQCSDDLQGSFGVALMRGSGGVPMIYGVLSVLRSRVGPIAFR